MAERPDQIINNANPKMLADFWRSRRSNLPRVQWCIRKSLWKCCLSVIILYFRIGITQLVISKSTLKTTSIPRLEFLSVSFGLKLANKIIDVYETNMEKVIFWCNSLNLLWWIRGMNQKFKSFLANRVWEIQPSTQPAHWRYVPCKESPADLVSRSIKQKQSVVIWTRFLERITRELANTKI